MRPWISPSLCVVLGCLCASALCCSASLSIDCGCRACGCMCSGWGALTGMFWFRWLPGLLGRKTLLFEFFFFHQCFVVSHCRRLLCSTPISTGSLVNNALLTCTSVINEQLRWSNCRLDASETFLWWLTTNVAERVVLSCRAGFRVLPRKILPRNRVTQEDPDCTERKQEVTDYNTR